MVFSGVAVSGAEDGSVSVLSGCVGAVAEGSGAVVALSAGVLRGVVGAVGAMGAIDSADSAAVTVLAGSWVLLCCEPVAGISPSIEFALSLTAQLPHLGVRVIVVSAAAFTVKVKPEVSFTDICLV